MNIGDRINYQTGWASWGTGRVKTFNPETEIVTVEDEDDGKVWTGPADMTEPAEGQG